MPRAPCSAHSFVIGGTSHGRAMHACCLAESTHTAPGLCMQQKTNTMHAKRKTSCPNTCEQPSASHNSLAQHQNVVLRAHRLYCKCSYPQQKVTCLTTTQTAATANMTWSLKRQGCAPCAVRLSGSLLLCWCCRCQQCAQPLLQVPQLQPLRRRWPCTPACAGFSARARSAGSSSAPQGSRHTCSCGR